MFTGIIESTGTIKNIQGSVFEITAPFVKELQIGQSVAHDGVCLTVTEILEDSYKVELIPESFARTHFKKTKKGQKINLERCTPVNGRLDGHIVQGHCDFVGEIISITKNKNATILEISIPEKYKNYFVEKGSVTVNGISLTVIEAEDTFFSVGIIPHTLEVTNLSELQIESLVNIETDILAKYFVKIFGKQ